MMFELTGSYQIVLPLLVACGIAAAVVQGALGGSIYSLGARRRGLLLARGGPSLSDLSVAQAIDPAPPMQADVSLTELLEIIGATAHAAFPVIDGGALLGLLSVRETRRALLDPSVDRSSTARSFTRSSKALLPDDDLGTADQRLAESGAAEALVVDAANHPLGVISREGILEAWRRATTAA
jgi:CIC family chloride channel protein